MYCKNCGTELSDDALFCDSCNCATEASVAPEPVQKTEIPEGVPAPVVTAKSSPKMNKTERIITIALVLSILLAVVCILHIPMFLPDGDADVIQGSQLSSTSSPAPPATDTSAPSTNENSVELVITPAELVYEMTDADVEKFYGLLADLKEAALGGKDGDTVMAISDAVDDQYDYMDAQLSIATVLYYCDLNDQAASQLYLDCDEQVSQANNDYLEMAKELYDSDFPAKERFFEDWTDLELAMLQNYTSEVMELRQRNSEITVAYQDLQDDEEMYTKMVPLYIEMVQNNNRLAQIFGYDNYYDYAYELSYDRDYGREEIHTMRSLVSQYLPEAIEDALNNFYISMDEMSTFQQMKLSAFLYDSFVPNYTELIEGYLGSLPQQMQEDMLEMFNGNIVMMDDTSSAMEGAFTTAINDDRMICFFGPDYMNPLTALHEVGHYYGGKHTEWNDIPLDLAETQSQGNEWLFMSYAADYMNRELHTTTVDYKLYSDLVTILLCVVIDEFEEQVYTHPDIANLTSDDLDAIMEQVCENYGSISFLDNYATNIQEYWRMVVVEQPVYYISYAVSAIASINVYTIAEEDYAQGVEVYRSLIEEVDLDEGFLGNIENAELGGPFDEDFYVGLQALID